MTQKTAVNRPKNAVIRLVGVQRTGSPGPENFEEIMHFYSGFFSRLREISPGGIHRIIRYEGILPDGTSQTFIGLEMKGNTIPPGMVAWNLSKTHRECTQGEISTRDEIRWQWIDQDSGIGEFFLDDDTGFIITAYTYTDPGLTSEDRVEISGYDPAWPGEYTRFSDWLITTAPDIILRTEHYGSTSIPGMPAKPVIDLLVEIPSFREARNRLLPLCNTLKWEYWFDGHITCIVREKFMGTRTHHIHLAPGDHPIWRQLAFRDYLREHPEDARRYADLKCDLADRYRNDREWYTNAKKSFVREIFTKIDSLPSSTR